MSDEWDLDNIDDLNLDDLDLLMDIEENPDVKDDRSAATKIAAGAWDSLRDRDTLTDIGKAFVGEALPDEYGQAADAVDDGLSDVARLYDDAKRDIKKPIDDLKKMIGRQVKEGPLADQISDQFKEKILPFLETPDESHSDERRVEDTAELALQAELNNIFNRQSQEADINRSYADLNVQLSRENVKGTAATNQLLSRLVGFNDTIIYEAQRKQLEFSMRQYNVQKNLLAVMTAFAEDQGVSNQAIIKNTALPEIAKLQGTEGLQTSLYQRIYGSVTDSVADYSRGFTDRLRENVGNMVGGLIGQFREGVGLAGELADGLTSAVEMADDLDKTEFLSGIASSEAGKWLASKAGKKAAKMLRKIPAIEKYAKDIEYFLSAYPQEATYFLANWNGDVFPGSMVERFPFLERINLAIISDKLKELTPGMDDQDLKVSNTLSKEALTPVPFDNITRRSIIEIIPGYLSRILNELSVQNGGDKDRLVYSVDKENFIRLSDATADIDNRLLSGLSSRRKRSLDDAVEKVGGELSGNLKDKLGDIILNRALAGIPFRMDEISSDSSLSDNEKLALASWFRSSSTSKQDIRKAFTRAMMDMAEGQVGIQRELNRLYASGQSDLLRGIGVITDEDSGEKLFTSQKAKEAIGTVLQDNRKNIKRDTTAEDLVAMITDPAVREEALKLIKDADILKQLKSLTVKDRRVSSIAEDITSLESEYNASVVSGQATIANDRINRRTVRSGTFDYKAPDNPFNSDVMNTINVGIDNSDVIDAIMSQTESMHRRFNVSINDQEGVPVHILNQHTGEGQVDAIREGFSELSQLMSMVVVNTSALADGEIVAKSGLTSLLEKGIQGGSSIIGSYIKGLYTGVSGIAKGTGSVIGGGLSAGGNIFKTIFGRRRVESDDKAQDVYVEGFEEPVMTREELLSGEYYDRETKKPITSLKDITGPVIDKFGNVKISMKQIRTGLFSKDDYDLSGLMNLAKKPLNALTGFYGNMFSALGGLKDRAIKAIKNIRRGSFDVYVEGEEYPRLKAIVMDNGGYVSVASEQVIYSPLDIDGPIMDQAGNVVLSLDDIQRGIVDIRGVPVGNFRTLGYIKDKASSVIGFAKNIAGRAKDMAGSAFSSIGGLFKRGKEAVSEAADNALLRSRANGNPLDEQLRDGEITAVTILAKIYDHMSTVWPLDGEGLSELLGPGAHAKLADEDNDDNASDRDGDGMRDNSLEEMMARRKQKAKAEEKQVKEQVDKGEGIWGRLFGLVGAIGPGIVSALGALGTTLLTALGISKGADAASDIADAAGDMSGDRRGRGRSRGRGRLGRLGRAASGLGSLAGKLGRGALSVGRTALAVTGGAGAMLLRGGAAVLGAVTTGVAGPVIATAALAYGGYKAYQYFSARSEAEPLERLRFMQYGLNPDREDHLVAIRELESEIIDEVIYTGTKPMLKMTPREAYEEYAESWGVDMNSEAEGMNWAVWFSKRFVPVLMTHLGVLKVMNVDVDLTDIDDELTDKTQRSSYLSKVIPDPRKGDPLQVRQFPIPGQTPFATRDDIIAYHEDLKAVASGSRKSESSKEMQVMNEAMKLERKKPEVSEYALRSANRATRNSTQTNFAYRTLDPNAASKKVAAISPVVLKADAPSLKGVKFILPVLETAVVTSPYGRRVHPKTGKVHYHKGVDWDGERGDPIYAAAAGKIYRREYSSTYGNVIYIRHENGMATRYAHLSNFAPGIHNDTVVKQGQLIGFMGNTGVSTGVHLHFEIRKTAAWDSETVNPLKLIASGKIDKQVKEQEKAAKTENKKPPSLDETIEGEDTIQSTAAPKQTVPKKQERPKLTLDKPKTKSEERREVQARMSMDKDFRKIMMDMSKQGSAAFEQRKEMISRLDRLIEIAENTDSGNTTQAQTPSQSTQRRTPPTVTPTIDLSQ
ncbi:glycoside hydrolase [Vibrio phage BONAISHI]|nr:glycoside hydrolase [Vibrio phage BONAISHI]